MKKFVLFAAMLGMAIGLAACGNNAQSAEQTGNASDVQQTESAVATEMAGTGAEKPDTITITALNGNKESVQIEVPYDPERVAILDMAALDILDNLGLGDRVVGAANTSLDYLSEYSENDAIENLGTIKEADLEATMACEPDIIFIGGRLSASYDALSEIAPVVYLATDTELGVVESTRNIAHTIASIFGLEDEVDEKMNGFQERIDTLSAFAEGKTALVGMCTSGGFNLLGNDGRCSLIGVEIGFNNIGVEAAASSGSGRGGNGNSGAAAESTEAAGSGTEESTEAAGSSTATTAGSTATHGNEASFELVVELAPEYIFVMDRDAAIGTEGAKLAQDIMENELVMSTDAYKNGNIVYLANPAVWYTAEGGITALDIMLSDLESALLEQ